MGELKLSIEKNVKSSMKLEVIQRYLESSDNQKIVINRIANFLNLTYQMDYRQAQIEAINHIKEYRKTKKQG